MKVLLFAGAGTSIELGVPAMRGLAEGFLEHCRQWNVQPELVRRILTQRLDIQDLIETLDQLCGARPSLDVIEEKVDSLEAAEEIRAEVEWFVQHSAERVGARDATLMWGPTLRNGQTHEVTLVTTNYDRAIEMAANAAGVRLHDGYAEFSDLETAYWQGFSGEHSEGVRLVKLHGSTDWYATDGTADPVKLRHPVALYGRSELRLPSGPRLRSALILPSREKMLTNKPYPRLSQAFLNAADECDLAVFVGSSLRDPHIAEAARSTAERASTFVVNPDGDIAVDGVDAIKQPASAFLVSTLPNALAGDPKECLEAARRNSSNGDLSILDAVRELSNKRSEARIRRDAIERLDATGSTLEADKVRHLLSDDDASVARYALSLVYGSSQVGELLEAAESSPHILDEAYQADLALLREMVESQVAKQR